MYTTEQDIVFSLILGLLSASSASGGFAEAKRFLPLDYFKNILSEYLPAGRQVSKKIRSNTISCSGIYI